MPAAALLVVRIGCVPSFWSVTRTTMQEESKNQTLHASCQWMERRHGTVLPAVEKSPKSRIIEIGVRGSGMYR